MPLPMLLCFSVGARSSALIVERASIFQSALFMRWQRQPRCVQTLKGKQTA